MAEKTVFIKGKREMYDDYVDFINYVFSLHGSSTDFKKLLPKLYDSSYPATENTYFALTDGKIKGVVGAFDHDISVCGTTIKSRGIGSVSVHPYSRGKGYMKTLMGMAMDEMISDGVALSVLGGRRQRYNYFGFDKLGAYHNFGINEDNMRHALGTERHHSIAFTKVKRSDTAILLEIDKLTRSLPFYPLRESERLFDILSSWNQGIFVGFDGDEFVGYATVKDSAVFEMLLVDESRVLEFVCALFDHLGGGRLMVKLPAFLPSYINTLSRFCEAYSIDLQKSYCVLNYRLVVDAFLRLKATYQSLPDGRLVLDIDGKAGREKIEIKVTGGVPSVEYTDDAADLSLSHLDASNLLFAFISPSRLSLPHFAQIWLPLPIYLYHSDAV